MAIRCVIVDDNDRFLRVAREVLERDGIAVVGVASTSAEALRVVDGLRPDVTLVDVDLGEESGFELAERFRGTRPAARPSVILISAYEERDFADLVAASPVLGYLSKANLSGTAVLEILGTGDDQDWARPGDDQEHWARPG
ncbi:response regulator [Actinoallomurus acanthiterrae]